MKEEYLIFNLLVVSGPVVLSFDRKVNFYGLWLKAFTASAITLVPFLLWDMMVAGKHWWFNDAYITGFRIAGLPVEELMFFITVPFACIFVWEVLGAYYKEYRMEKAVILRKILYFSIIPAAVFLINGKIYTALVLSALSLTALLDRILDTGIFTRSRTYLELMLVTILILVFNGYLTARPIVLYDSAYHLNFRIMTIPVEDFFYGYAHIFSSVIVYLKLKGDTHG
ncbi:MAG: lycopene cyclase domain-containing protein [Calditrichaceae bacterium]